jgi:ABC-2 type transport system ATP-binding protein
MDRITGPIIRVDGVRKRYGSVTAVDGVSFEVNAGEVFGLLGPNGAGKTTTVEMLEGLRSPDEGRLEVLGLDVARYAATLKTRIGVQLQTPSLYPRLTVDEVIDLFASFYPRARSTDELVAALDLGERRTAQTRNLSGGQKQRLSVALALVNDPELIFLDEPTTGMDPAARRSLWDLIRRLREEGRTVLLTTHYMEEAEELCDRVAVMDHGRILEMGTVEDLISRHFSERTIFFDSIDTLADSRLASLPGVTRVKHEDHTETLLYTSDVAATIAGLLEATDAAGLEPRNLGIRRPSLEDVFLELTGRALRD